LLKEEEGKNQQVDKEKLSEGSCTFFFHGRFDTCTKCRILEKTLF